MQYDDEDDHNNNDAKMDMEGNLGTQRIDDREEKDGEVNTARGN